jgi:hypothetical protein
MAEDNMTNDDQQIVVPTQQTGAQQPIVINVSNVNTNSNVNNNTNINGNGGRTVSVKSKMVTLLLCIFLGYFGAHCFYAGRFGRGILYFFTLGIFGLGWIWDVIQILRGKFTDKYGLPITE